MPLSDAARYRSHAAKCRLAAAEARAPAIAQMWLQQERRWLLLAADCTGLEGLAAAVAEAGALALRA
jgi:hypothetical protein